MKKLTSKFSISVLLSAAGALFAPTLTAYALPPIRPDVSVNEFDSLTVQSITGWIIGFIMWALRLAGLICLLWGIYSLVTCRKDGDADGINIGVIKSGIGLVMVCMPAVMKAIGIIH